MTTLAHSDPLVLRHPGGEIAVSFDGGESWVRWRTLNAYNACREFLDREQAAFEQPAKDAFVAACDAYWARVQALHAERDELRSAG